ncbi:COX15/CtaA family protein [Roseomonas sp. CAU 1739]|uniref:COX15/CtaA family protein n=1 Tax=Roseomonas sp. CAU 1739 TaxID=3140364 RepID=UPI00325B072A
MPFDSRVPAAPAAEGSAAHHRAVARWLLFVAGLVWIMVAIGGATRLTGSGLSIMEWAPITGMLPPVSDAEWNRLYDLYRTIPQYQLVNQGFGLEGFKQIFWLEWIHRFWGRLIGIAYVAGLAWFWLRGQVPAGYRGRLLLLLALGGLQGAVGWFMVASGFDADRTAVSPYRLVIHLSLAFLLFGVLVWTAMTLLRPRPEGAPVPPALRRLVHAAAGLAVLAMLAGGFVAGIRAGFDYNTFPLMEGRLLPRGYWVLDPGWKNLTANIPAVQFNHRLLATATLIVAGWAAVLAFRALPRGRVRGAVTGLAIAVALQYALGVATLLAVVPPWLGTLHQSVAVLVLTGALLAIHALRQPPPPAGSG